MLYSLSALSCESSHVANPAAPLSGIHIPVCTTLCIMPLCVADTSFVTPSPAPIEKTCRSTNVSRFSMTSIWLLNSDRSNSLVSFSRPSILVMRLKDRSSHVKFV